MALEQEVMQQQAPSSEQPVEGQTAPEEERLSADEEDDLAIAVMLAETMIDDGGINVIHEAVQSSNDPGQVIGEFLMQLVAQMSEQMPPEAQMSPRIFFAEGGWVEQVSDYLQDQYDVPKEVMDRAEMFIAAQASNMAAGAVQQQQQTGAAPQAPMSSPQAGLEGAVTGGMV